MTPDDILDEALHILERDGWHQGGLVDYQYDRPEGDDRTEDEVRYEHWQATHNAPVCAVGALNRAYTGAANGYWTFDEDTAATVAFSRLRAATGVDGQGFYDIPDWNDDENTTKEDVVLAFKRARRGE